MANDYYTSWERLLGAIRSAHGAPDVAGVTDVDHLSVDQQLKVAEITALLSISQELSGIRTADTD